MLYKTTTTEHSPKVLIRFPGIITQCMKEFAMNFITYLEIVEHCATLWECSVHILATSQTAPIIELNVLGPFKEHRPGVLATFLQHYRNVLFNIT
jgi:hypothetical protein